LWRFDDETYTRTATSFDSPDFVDVVIHSYRHRYGLVAGDSRYDDIEQRLASQPLVSVPTITLDPARDGLFPLCLEGDKFVRFTGRHENRVVPDAGHNLPQETPDAFAQAILDVDAWTSWRFPTST
jgi:pimeloyl-ACP methyl ester carboxylesterase